MSEVDLPVLLGFEAEEQYSGLLISSAVDEDAPEIGRDLMKVRSTEDDDAAIGLVVRNKEVN